MLIQKKHVLQPPVSAIKNFQDSILNKSELSFEFKQDKIKLNKVSEIFYTSIDFLPLVNFINKGDIEFEFLLRCAEQDEEQKETSKAIVPLKEKVAYNLHHNSCCSSQEKATSSTDYNFLNTKDAILKTSDTSNSVITEHAYAKPIKNASMEDVQNGKNLTKNPYSLRRSKRIAKHKLTVKENASSFIKKLLPKKQKASSHHVNHWLQLNRLLLKTV